MQHVTRYSRKSLRVLGSVGEPINPSAWRWYFNVVGDSRCPISDTWWQTETGGFMITPLPGAWPQKPGSATLPFFGVQPVIVDEKGIEIEDMRRHISSHSRAIILVVMAAAGIFMKKLIMVYAAREKNGVYMPNERYYQEESERKAMADQIKQMGVTIENHQKQFEELRDKFDAENELAQGQLSGTAFDRYCMVLFAGIAAEALSQPMVDEFPE
ncbi:hypothetical protein POM88_043544 [Heracleum sosnowskyi]|uniref:acetate--CoA ligase n=1 Tax=Heracleum sosnowskyi TaxID=360622 RepID=A0AAD8M243_9APIA|nr:hypothetical protein POM88_043544 [Heracleum sosnowskyi]